MATSDPKPLTSNQEKMLDALADMPDDQINLSDPDSKPMRDWSSAQRGVFYRPVKQQVTLRLDADLIDWFREHAGPDGKYQRDINAALRLHVEREEAQRKAG
jgi:uncharacterized protein (DUF4415 family)